MTTYNNTTNPHFLHRELSIYALVAFLVAMLLAFTASAQERVMTLDEAIKLGVENSKALKLSNTRIERAVAQYNQAKDESLPTGSASFGYSRAQIPANRLEFGEESFSLPKSANAYLGTLSLSQVIFAGNKLKYARESTELLTQIARLDEVNDKDQIVYNIISSYYNLYKVLQGQKVVQQNIATIDQQIKQSQRFFEQGIVTKNDVLQFQLQRSNVELNGIDLENNRKIVNYNLNILLGLPETTQLRIEQVAGAEQPMGMLNSYIDTALANRPELQQADLQAQVADKNISSVKANTLPNLAAAASAYYVGVAANPLPKSGSYITPISIGLTASWNFGALWTNKHKVAEAKIQRTEADINKSITVDRIKNEVNQNYQTYISALEKIRLLQTSIAQAGENNKILESKYRSNIASAVDRADAQTLLYQAQINLELAKADAGLAYYTLLKSTGKLNK
ncbi:TolC family protein [Mucilaginibacter limnophilus]|uniref:TolC family protein n=1 Tax=Mucilaginibacter limnophilus TaxID=1932778 RepID=A0A3S3TGA1_9SPHI|nr:TolC family protein [Mucilaginibacter limnophilus]RVU00391.1 TolC family protein [Mucilaginibacter limnophilus]